MWDAVAPVGETHIYQMTAYAKSMSKAITVLAIVAIVLALGAVTSLFPTASSFGPKYPLKPHHFGLAGEELYPAPTASPAAHQGNLKKHNPTQEHIS